MMGFVLYSIFNTGIAWGFGYWCFLSWESGEYSAAILHGIIAFRAAIDLGPPK